MSEPETLQLTGSETLAVTTDTPELLEVEATWEGGHGKPPPPHLHPSQDERFVVHEGELTVEIGGETRTLRGGDTLEVPRGTPHRMWNAGAATARATWQTRPALRTIAFWRSMDEARRTRPTNADGILGPVAAAPILKRHRAEFQLAIPAPLERTALAVLGTAARIKGYN
ncbi:MAG TPA: cupin domain-containing protein [Baekduia sp.]|nr:cupin domain-containing protein [Baekduia sp.]